MKSVLINGFVAISLLMAFGASDAFALSTFNRMRCQVDVDVDAFGNEVPKVQIQVKLDGLDTLDVWVTTDTTSGTFFSPIHMNVLSEGGTVSVDWDTFPDAEGSLVAPGGVVLTIPGDFVADGGIIAAHARYVGGDLDGQLVLPTPVPGEDPTSGIDGANLAVCATKVSAQFRQQTKPNPNITVIDRDDPTNVDPTSGNLVDLPWGSVTINTSSDKVVWVKNDGLKDLDIISVTQEGNSTFSIPAGQDTCSGGVKVTPGGKCSFSIRFSPLEIDVPQNGSVTVLSKSPGEESVTFSLSGEGSPVPAPKISIIPAGGQLSYGDVSIGGSKELTVTISNSGNEVLHINSFSELSAPYSRVDTGSCVVGIELQPGMGSCTFDFQFSPTAEGVAIASFDITWDGGTETVNLSGTGVTALVPDIDIQDSQGPARDRTIDFGRLTAGQTLIHTVTLTNMGTDSLEISFMANETGGTNPLEVPFTLASNTCSGMLAPGEGCVLEVQFAPDVPGDVNDAVVIESNDPDEPVVTVSVSGTVLSPAINHAPGASHLESPANGQQSVSIPAVLVFSKSSDPDGNPVHYTVHICEDEPMTEGCITPVEIWETGASAERKAEKNTSYAGLGLGAGMVFGIVFIGGTGRRKKIGMFMAAMILAGTLLSSCSGGAASPPAKSAGEIASAGEGTLVGEGALAGEDPAADESPLVTDLSVSISGLEQEKTYYWEVIATDDFGGEAVSDVWHFTTQ